MPKNRASAIPAKRAHRELLDRADRIPAKRAHRIPKAMAPTQFIQTNLPTAKFEAITGNTPTNHWLVSRAHQWPVSGRPVTPMDHECRLVSA